jgi:hypothetical protein
LSNSRLLNMRTFIIILFASFSLNVYSQSKHQVDSLLSSVCLTKDSKDIVKGSQAKRIIAYGNRLLPTLSDFFSDTTATKVKSDCQGRFLNRGEVAIILADKIELMPYAVVTGIQNCTLEFCKNNPNGIEFYLNAIKQNGIEKFSKKYNAWLDSNERKTWPPSKINKASRKAKTL